MLPVAYQVPAALILIVGGLLACFAGYRLFRAVLAIYGFILGALFASSLVAPNNALMMLVAALVGGLVGAVVLWLAYFVGVVLVGAGVGALVAHLLWTQIGRGDPPAIAVIVLAVVGAIGAWIFQRVVIIVGTAFGGSWTALSGFVAMQVDHGQRITDQVWLAYPTNPAPGQRWFVFAWLVLGLIGTAAQFGATSRRPRPKPSS